MFGLNKREYTIFIIALALVMFLPYDAQAEAFGGLKAAGKKIFEGLREIIYPASAIGIIMVCIGGFFGNVNWKWLTALVIGLIVISLCGGFITLFAGNGEWSSDLNAPGAQANMLSGA